MVEVGLGRREQERRSASRNASVKGHDIPHGRAKLIPHPFVNGNKFTSPIS